MLFIPKALVDFKGVYLIVLFIIYYFPKKKKGFRLICVSKLPINKSTIIYGSSDVRITIILFLVCFLIYFFLKGGRNVHNSSLVSKRICNLANKLNLRGHQVGPKKDCIIHGSRFIFKFVFF